MFWFVRRRGDGLSVAWRVTCDRCSAWRSPPQLRKKVRHRNSGRKSGPPPVGLALALGGNSRSRSRLRAAGHLRTNAGGANLNREWRGGVYDGYSAPTRARSPEVWHIRISSLNNEE